MESSTKGKCTQNSKKRVLPGASSSSKTKMVKQNEDTIIVISQGPDGAMQQHLIKRVKGIIMSSAASSTIHLDSLHGVSVSHKGKHCMDLHADASVSEDEYSHLQSRFDSLDLPTGIEASIPWFPDGVKAKSKMASARKDIPSAMNGQVLRTRSDAARPAKTPQRFLGSSSNPYSSRQAQRDAIKVRPVKKPLKVTSRNMPSGAGGSSSRNRHDGVGPSRFSQSHIDALYPQGVDPQAIAVEQNIARYHHSGGSQKSLNVAEGTSSMGQLGDDDVMRKYKNFKKFDIVEDHSDHQYSVLDSPMEQPTRNWAKKIQEEWRILEKHLPDMIFVRVYESRMDLLRAVIIGAEGTPYHDGLFFFDMWFPSNYPNIPPVVRYHSHGLGINPNLYKNGYVCLSLLNTWSGVQREKWTPGVSTMLQVLVSIQGLILNAKPYFNEPGYEDLIGSVDGQNYSQQYNERTLILSLKTMVYTMKQPPKYFEDMVIGHFHDRAHGILMTCKAYAEGARAGCLVNEGGESSLEFKKGVERYAKKLVRTFKQIGAKNVNDAVSPRAIMVEQNVAGSSSGMEQLNNNVPRNYQNFKKFDVVEDYSDHHFSTVDSVMKQPPRKWAKRVQEEWRILEKDLPDMIFVRVYESRMDLLRAVIIGAEGTPYHDGLFFFDVWFPSNYPNVPPRVHYHSGGERINPNLYRNGDVCLSLLNTWIGDQKEAWIPGVSTMLQVLVSIQGLVLNAKPYFNEAGFEESSGTVDGEIRSLQYNERTLIVSLKTMVCTINHPPKHFEDLVIGHFCDRAHDILMTCKAYTEGARVGCLDGKGGSQEFKNDVGRYSKTLVGALKQTGAENVYEFLSLTQKIRAFFGFGI